MTFDTFFFRMNVNSNLGSLKNPTAITTRKDPNRVEYATLMFNELKTYKTITKSHKRRIKRAACMSTGDLLYPVSSLEK